jgi:3-oxoacyl-[acyl-carrier protein] reductase
MTKKRVLVTGASRGIGRAVMRRLAEDGYWVTGFARKRPEDLHADEDFHCIDLANLEETRALVTKLAAEQPFYGLVNNAAMALLNMYAPLVCTQAVVPGMRAAKEGRIVNLSSRAALGKVNRTAYSASKAGIIGMTRTFALELAEHNITVNAIAPGPIATEMFRTASPPDDPRTKALKAAVPLKRVGEPEEIAHAVAFLLEARGGFMTGQTLYIDGGLTVSAVHL